LTFSIDTSGKGNIVCRSLFHRYVIIAESPKAQTFRTDLEKEASRKQEKHNLKEKEAQKEEA
jgi:hypothetical protein